MNSKIMPPTVVAKVIVRVPQIKAGIIKTKSYHTYEHLLESAFSAVEKITINYIFHGLTNSDFGSDILAHVEIQQKSFNHVKTISLIITKDRHCDKAKKELCIDRKPSPTATPIDRTNFYLKFNPLR